MPDFEESSENSMTINGFEELQALYKDYMEKEKWRDKKLKKACVICELFIIVRLQALFSTSKNAAIDQQLDWANIPLFATAHD